MRRIKWHRVRYPRPNRHAFPRGYVTTPRLRISYSRIPELDAVFTMLWISPVWLVPLSRQLHGVCELPAGTLRETSRAERFLDASAYWVLGLSRAIDDHIDNCTAWHHFRLHLNRGDIGIVSASLHAMSLSLSVATPVATCSLDRGSEVFSSSSPKSCFCSFPCLPGSSSRGAHF